ncbi:GNAT family N-acetyltransferase [Dinghuibacter silviterrae]|uniref:RimJ/RimL family protein N-acetyltransferase n=1 Tax=Dinghuibacter silviterrae TaxID=1539049 RepID=A0A4R8DVT6_9BACT|nr:GNAT family N-acetyltransferase [Dinghuibacter silviterrae]TDX01585.1 RimJ/RimL family protein N-acetyltransferase [Dinghuibacter silviterrae]
MTVYLETDRLLLRDWLETDTEPYIRMNLDPDVRRYFPGLAAPEDSLASIEKMQNDLQSQGYGLFAVALKGSGDFIGFTGFAHPGFEAFFTPSERVMQRIGMEKTGTFLHPRLPGGHWLQEHVLYRAFSPSRNTISR